MSKSVSNINDAAKAIKSAKPNAGNKAALAKADAAKARIAKLADATAPIKGVPNDAKKARIRAKHTAAPGGKLGQAQPNQGAGYSAADVAEMAAPAKAKVKAKAPKAERKLPAPNPDIITSIKNNASGHPHVIAETVAGSVAIPRGNFTAKVAELAKVGASLAALKAYIAANPTQAKLARGLNGHDAPHSAKAAADSRKGAPTAPQMPAAKAPPAPKAPAKAKLAPKGTDRTYTVLNANHGAKPSSKRARQLDIVLAHTSTAAAKAKGAEGVDFAYAVAQGFIKYN